MFEVAAQQRLLGRLQRECDSDGAVRCQVSISHIE